MGSAKSINRIYQGRVVKVEKDGKEFKDWEDLLLKHHEIFQSAVNYYLLCLVALATGKNRPSNDRKCPVHALQEQMKEKWRDFNYKGVKRDGLQKSVGRYLFPDNFSPSFEDCLKKVLEGNKANKESLHKALDELTEGMGSGSGAIRQSGVTFFPMFCEKDTKANFPREKNKRDRERGEYKLKTELLEIEACLDTDEKYNKKKKRIKVLSEEIEYSWLANISKRHSPKAIKARLNEAIEKVEKWVSNNQKKIKPFFDQTEQEKELKNIKKRLEVFNINSKVAFEKTNIQTQIGLLFKHFPSRFTTILICVLWNQFDKTLTEKKQIKINKLKQENENTNKLDKNLLVDGRDPIEYCRGERGYIFPAFTAWPKWGSSAFGIPQWKEFDIAAFKEALTVIHQIDEKTKEREKEKGKYQKSLDWMTKGYWVKKNKKGEKQKETKWQPNKNQDEETEGAEPPFLGDFKWNKEKRIYEDIDQKPGDSRIKLLLKLLEQDLADEGTGKIPYGLKRRTLRGFNDIKKKWRSKSKNKPYSEALKKTLEEELNSYQKKNKYSIGSAPLFKELLEKENWIIWQEPGEQKQEEYDKQGFAENPLEALCDWYELKADVEKLDRSVQFTPADPEHSRRLFRFGDVASGFNRTSGKFGHDKDSLSFRVPIIFKTENNKLEQKDIKIHYSAPRLFRDSLRKESEEDLGKMPWLQPMMSALGFSETLEQNFEKCNVQLMPDKNRLGKWRFLINFSIPLSIDKLQSQIAGDSQVDWQKNCKAGGDKYLKWPKNSNWDGDKKMDQVDWFKKTDQFSCLSIDLGQRSAGAFALITVENEKVGKGKIKNDRYIGSANNKKWFAGVKDMGLLRLPGEDMKFYQKGTLKTEPYGYKGRKASKDELEETEDIISCLDKSGEFVKELLGEEKKALSFPELNDKLLVAVRRSQSKLSRYYRWVWMLGENDRKEKALKEIKEQEDQKDWAELAKEEENAQHLQILIKGTIPNFQKEIEKKLLTLAGRILPLRGRSWRWEIHP